jgi:hypothetical protein
MTRDVAQALQLRGLLRGEDIPTLAAELLERGRDTPTIRRLAGLTGMTSTTPRNSSVGSLRNWGCGNRLLTKLRLRSPGILAEAALMAEADLRALAADGARLAVAFDHPDVLMPFYNVDDCYDLPELFATASVDSRLIDYARTLVQVTE